MSGLNVREVGHARATRNYALAEDNLGLPANRGHVVGLPSA